MLSLTGWQTWTSRRFEKDWILVTMSAPTIGVPRDITERGNRPITDTLKIEV